MSVIPKRTTPIEIATDAINDYLNNPNRAFPVHSVVDFFKISLAFNEFLQNPKIPFDNRSFSYLKIQHLNEVEKKNQQQLFEFIQSISEVLENPDSYIKPPDNPENEVQVKKYQENCKTFIETVKKVIEQKKNYLDKLSPAEKQRILSDRKTLDEKKKMNDLRRDLVQANLPKKESPPTDDELISLSPEILGKLPIDYLRLIINHMNSRNITFTYLRTIALENSELIGRIIVNYGNPPDKDENDEADDDPTDDGWNGSICDLLKFGIPIETIIELEKTLPGICSDINMNLQKFLDCSGSVCDVLFTLENPMKKFILENLDKCINLISLNKCTECSVRTERFNVLIQLNPDVIKLILSNDAVQEIFERRSWDYFKTVPVEFWMEIVANQNFLLGLRTLFKSNFTFEDFVKAYDFDKALLKEILDFNKLLVQFADWPRIKNKTQLPVEKVQLYDLVEFIKKFPNDEDRKKVIELTKKLLKIGIPFSVFNNLALCNVIRILKSWEEVNKFFAVLKRFQFQKLAALNDDQWKILLENKRNANRVIELHKNGAEWNDIISIKDTDWIEILTFDPLLNKDIDAWLVNGAKLSDIIGICHIDTAKSLSTYYKSEIETLLSRNIPFIILAKWILQMPQEHKFLIVQLILKLSKTAEIFSLLMNLSIDRLLQLTKNYERLAWLLERKINIREVIELDEQQFNLKIGSEPNFNIVQQLIKLNVPFTNIAKINTQETFSKITSLNVKRYDNLMWLLERIPPESLQLLDAQLWHMLIENDKHWEIVKSLITIQVPFARIIRDFNREQFYLIVHLQKYLFPIPTLYTLSPTELNWVFYNSDQIVSQMENATFEQVIENLRHSNKRQKL